MNRVLLFLSLLFFATCGVLIGTPSAQAATMYDSLTNTKTPNVIELCKADLQDCDQLNYEAVNNFMLSFCGVDTLNLWKYTYETQQTNYAFTKQEAYKSQITSYDNITLYFTTDELQPPATFDFIFSGNNSSNLGFITEQSNTYYFSLNRDFSTGEYLGNCDNILHGTPIMLAEQGRGGSNTSFCQVPVSNYPDTCNRSVLISSMYQITYPEDFEGNTHIVNPPFAQPPAETISTSPNWYISNIFDGKGKFHDSNFNTIDEPPFLCTDDLAPVLNWELFRIASDETEYKIAQGVQSATAEINYDFGSSDLDRTYLILGWYDCGDGTVFPNQGRLTFTIDKNGMQKIDLFQSCVDKDFPFIHFDGCYANLATTINLLIFNEVEFPSFAFNPSCHNLNVMDDWLNLPNNHQICPQIPEFVRNVTTPFVAFLLGIVTLGFINKVRGDFDG